ncbi:MAG: hypothetical protein IJT56_03655 [Clostridia bacterium]|nr:hypothetical protein [Clostridia bacterium]
MKYGESAFDILYLLTAVIIGALILIKAKNRTERMMGTACLILGCGDAFHLVPRVLSYFADGDFTAALGIGKLVTSVTMTVFYIFMYHIAEDVFRLGKQPKLRAAVYILSAVRVIVCLFPQNGWLTNESGMLWGILRNIPFTALGVIIIVIWFKNREKTRRFRLIWLWVLLSFAFYIPVTVFAGVVPMLGMLMLPKTICYVAMIVTFLRAVTGGAK